VRKKNDEQLTMSGSNKGKIIEKVSEYSYNFINAFLRIFFRRILQIKNNQKMTQLRKSLPKQKWITT
jgi:hypothetical protein